MVPAYSVKVPRVSTYSGSRLVNFPFAYGAFTLSGRLSQNRSAKLTESIPRSEPQDARTLVWALPISLAATFGITCCFLFLRLLRCFSSPGSLCIPMDSVCSDGGLLRRVSPFRHLRINGYLLLPEAFRSLSRLSSALSAKASTIRSFMHDQLALKAGGGFSARQEIYFLMCLKNPADICEANDIDRTGRSGDDRFKALPPLYSSKTHTYIALYALVFGQFFALFSSKCVIITQFPVITITSDVLIKIF